MTTYEFKRCEPDSPNRCQALSHKNRQQCPFAAVESTQFCPRHGPSNKRATIKVMGRLYALGKLQERANQHIDHPRLKTTREEIGIMRVLLEKKLLSCQDDDQKLLMQAGSIQQMLREISKTVKDCAELEMIVGTVLDETQAKAWVQEIGEILSKYLIDPDILEMISEDLLESLERRIDPTRNQNHESEE